MEKSKWQYCRSADQLIFKFMFNKSKTKTAMDDEKFVCLVQEHPELYDKRSPLYKLNGRKKSVWDAIGKELQCPGELCARRWTALRERFSKESRKVEAPSGSGGHRENHWPLLETMMFLKQHIVPRPFRCSKNVCPAPKPVPVTILPQVDCTVVQSPALQFTEAASPQPVLLQPDASFSLSSDSQSSWTSPSSPLPQPVKTQNKKRKANDDSVDELMVEAIQSFKRRCETKETTHSPVVESFATFIKATLSTVDGAKQGRIITSVTAIIMYAVADPDY